MQKITQKFGLICSVDKNHGLKQKRSREDDELEKADEARQDEQRARTRKRAKCVDSRTPSESQGPDDQQIEMQAILVERNQQKSIKNFFKSNLISNKQGLQ